MDELLAKSNPPESIRQHTDKLLELLEQLLIEYPESLTDTEYQLVKVCSEYHDYGKAIYGFQKRVSSGVSTKFRAAPEMEQLYRKLEHFPHGYVSPAFLPLNELIAKFKMEGTAVIINAIFYHHNRKSLSDEDIKSVIDKDLRPRFGNDYPISVKYLSKVGRDGNSFDKDQWLRFAVVKGTLNRLDYAASALNSTLEEARLHNHKSFAEIVGKKLAEHYTLRPVQEYMKNNNDKNLVVIASTGIGKTEAACLWGGDSKMFYTLPLKVSINAIYKRLYGTGHDEYGFSGCTLLHSDSLNILLENEGEDDSFVKYNKSRLFSYPVTVCTVDQLFTFVYRYRGSEIILSVLKYSKIVIDEIQAYSPEIAAKLLVGLKMITQVGGKFAIITATMPPVLENEMRSLEIQFEKPEPFFSVQPRHFLRFAKGEMDYDTISRLSQTSKVLVICNTVKRACQVYSKLQDKGNVHLLHSHFKQAHRRLLENKVIEFSGSSECGIWVTTQIVEASLDIDFDYLFTEMCCADSLLQRLGRCWRQRTYLSNEPNIFVYDTGNGVGTVYDQDIYVRSVELISQYCGKVFTEKDKNLYICAVYDTEALKQTKYYQKLHDTLWRIDSISPSVFSAEKAKNAFRDILSISVIDDNDYNSMLQDGTLDKTVTGLRSDNLKERAVSRQLLLDHTISINPQYFKIKPDMSCPIPGSKTRLAPIAYRISAKYDFNETTCQGLGLIAEEAEGANML